MKCILAKSSKQFGIVAVLACLIAVPTVLAVPQVQTVGNYGPYQTGSGGEFTLQALGNTVVTADLAFYSPLAMNQYASATPNFQTFCVEGNEYIYPNTLYDVTLGQKTVYGNTVLTVGAAYLYYEFATGGFNGTGGLPTYNYGAGRSTSADQLQKAIWWLMGQEGQVYNAANPYELLVNNKYGAAAFTANNSSIPVSVLNLWVPGADYTEAGARQDQLILTGRVPDGGLTVLMLGMSFVGLSALRRGTQK